MSITTQQVQDDVFEAKRVVRTFSWKAIREEPDNTLAGSLIVAAGKPDGKSEITLREQWLDLFDPQTQAAFSSGSQEENMLALPTEELAQVYKTFLKCLPKEHRVRIEDGPPRLDVVVKALAVADTNWKAKRDKTKGGKMKTLFGKVAGSLNSHRDLFAVVPSGDKYVCLLTGSISAIVKATVNHDKIAEAVSNALDDLSDDVAYWKDLLELNKLNVRMKEYVARLYVVVFKFLVNIMVKWSRSSISRLLSSFDSDFFKDEIEDKKKSIGELERRLNRQASLAMQRTMQHAPTLDQVRMMMAGYQAELDVQFQKLGQDMVKTLQAQYLNVIWDQREALTGGRHLPDVSANKTSLISGRSVDSGATYAVKQIQFDSSRCVRPFAPLDHSAGLCEPAQDININVDIFGRIRQWNASTTSEILWIQGPFQAPIPSRYTLMSAYMVATAQRAGIPAISYFCQQSSDITDVTYSIIEQLVQILPEHFHSQFDFTSARFDSLDGTTATLGHAVELLQDLLAVGPCPLYIIIDGLQILDTASNRSGLSMLVGALNPVSHKAGTRDLQIIKVLITTDGFADVLTSLEGDERLDAMDFEGEEGQGAEADGMEVSFL